MCVFVDSSGGMSVHLLKYFNIYLFIFLLEFILGYFTLKANIILLIQIFDSCWTLTSEVCG